MRSTINETHFKRKHRILQSKKNYDNIATLLELASEREDDLVVALFPTVSLCRVFLRLLVSRSLSHKTAKSEREAVASASTSHDLLATPPPKAETQINNDKGEAIFSELFLKDIVGALVCQQFENVQEEFRKAYMGDDILANCHASTVDNDLFDGVLDMLSYFESIPASTEDLGSLCVDLLEKKSQTVLQLHRQKKPCQSAWRIVISAYTLGVFYLIQNRNLYYTSFYPKLYSLLNTDILNSKHHQPRLCLNVLPSANVAIAPEARAAVESEGMDDPFNEEEVPMQTQAINSCLWEILIVAEPSNSVMKLPVDEFMIPKQIFQPNDPASGVEDNLVVK
ncbi:nucleolar complex protein [Xylaria digitata]|nr:nucleolar complex protein [Xylaria digitata]